VSTRRKVIIPVRDRVDPHALYVRTCREADEMPRRRSARRRRAPHRHCMPATHGRPGPASGGSRHPEVIKQRSTACQHHDGGAPR
jgi:hypothetical protein